MVLFGRPSARPTPADSTVREGGGRRLTPSLIARQVVGLCRISPQQCPLCRDALEGKGPQRRPQERPRRLEEVAEAVAGGYCRLQMLLKPALAVRGTVAGHRQGTVEGGGYPPPLPMHPCPCAMLLPRRGRLMGGPCLVHRLAAPADHRWRGCPAGTRFCPLPSRTVPHPGGDRANPLRSANRGALRCRSGSAGASRTALPATCTRPAPSPPLMTPSSSPAVPDCVVWPESVACSLEVDGRMAKCPEGPFSL